MSDLLQTTNMARTILTKVYPNLSRLYETYRPNNFLSTTLAAKQKHTPFCLFYRQIFFLFSNPSKRLKSTDTGSDDKSWKLNTNYFNDHHNKEIYGPIRKKHSQNRDRKGTKWTEEEEHQVMQKEIQIKLDHPNLKEIGINQLLSAAFSHSRTAGSYGAHRKTPKWKGKVAELLKRKQKSLTDIPQAEISRRQAVESEEKSESFWLNRQQEIVMKKKNELLRKNYNQMQPHHKAIAGANAVPEELRSHLKMVLPDTNAGLKQSLAEMSEILSNEVKQSNILEHGAKGKLIR